VTTILVVEDDPAILRGLTDNLRFEDYEVLTATDGETGYKLQRENNPDLIVLDVMLPRMSGLEVCRKLRSDGVQTPILMLTARSEEADRVLGLDLGADDYLTKPFSVRELMARIRALLRRAQPPASLPDELRFGDVEVDFRRYAARRNGAPVEMTRKEFAVLRLLAARAGEVVTRDELLNQVWGYESYPASRTVDNHVAGLRAKLERDAARPDHIRTVHGVGYKFVTKDLQDEED
jgi:DNA-binding response OmpR family regulator